MFYAVIKGLSPFSASARSFTTFNAAMNHAVESSERNNRAYEVLKIEVIATVGEKVPVGDRPVEREMDNSFSAENLKAASEWSKRLNGR